MIIVATNVAETSLTIPGVCVYVCVCVCVYVCVCVPNYDHRGHQRGGDVAHYSRCVYVSVYVCVPNNDHRGHQRGRDVAHYSRCVCVYVCVCQIMIIVATNVAETSLTIPGVCLCADLYTALQALLKRA